MGNRRVWIAGLIALAAVVLLIARSTNDRREQPPAPPPPPVPSPKPEPGVKVENVQCPACQGYGYVIVPERDGRRKRTCKLCAGKGGKELRIPPGNVVCPDCEGFGKVERRREGYRRCPRCSGQGYVKAPFEPSP